MTKMIAQTVAPASGGFPPSMIIVWLLFIGGFYFLFIAPQRKKQKEHDKMLTALQTGDEVVTTGGIYGVITNVKDDRFVVRIAENTKIEVGKGFIQSVAKKPEIEEKKSS
jgi:preprotein translocase subunit YajC